METPQISIITVCRNNAEGLRLTAQSVLALEGDGLEFVIVDGASTDHTTEAIRDIQQQAASRGMRLSWVSEADRGIYDGMNKGTRMAHGEWLIFMNGGDAFAAPDVLLRLRESGALDGREVGIVYGSVNQLMDFGTIEMRPSAVGRLQKKMAFCHQAAFIRRPLLLEHPYDLCYRIAADYEFFYWCYTSQKTFREVDFPIANFESEHGQSQQHRLRMNREYGRINGRAKNLRWKVEYVLKALEISVAGLSRHLLPQSLLDRLRKRNYERKARKLMLSSTPPTSRRRR